MIVEVLVIYGKTYMFGILEMSSIQWSRHKPCFTYFTHNTKCLVLSGIFHNDIRCRKPSGRNIVPEREQEANMIVFQMTTIVTAECQSSLWENTLYNNLLQRRMSSVVNCGRRNRFHRIDTSHFSPCVVSATTASVSE